jgi:hypothetical protein
LTNAFTQSLDQGGDGRCLAETGYQANGNNPLSLVDPSGHFFGVIFAIVALVGQIVSAVFAVIGLLAIAVMKAITAVVLAGKVLLAKAVKFTMAVVKTSYGWMKTVGSKLITAVKAQLGNTWVGKAVGAIYSNPVSGGAFTNAAWSGIQTARQGGGWKDVFRSAAKGAVIGAIGAVVGMGMHGLGEAVGSFASAGFAKGNLGGTLLHAAAHGVSGGAMAAANGGSFKDGFMGGAIGFGVGLAFGPAGVAIRGTGADSIAARTAIAAVGGGVGSKLAGGSFADGAYSAAFFHLFNGEVEAIFDDSVTAPVSEWTKVGEYSAGGESGDVLFGPLEPIEPRSGGWSRFWDGLQSALDVGGMIPGIGEPLDLVNGVIHVVRGNYGQAALSFAAMVPVVGNIVSATKHMARGRAAHRLYKAGIEDGITTFKEYRGIPGIRPDFVDFNTRTIYELKPNNPRQIANGHRQLERYRAAFERAHGPGWNVVLDTY